MNTIIQADARDLANYIEPNEIDLTITSPPYFDAIDYENHLNGEDYSGDQDITSNGMSTYIEQQREILTEVKSCTRPGGYLAVVIGTVNSSNRLIPLPHRFAAMLEETGWVFTDRIIWHKVTGGSRRFGVTIQHPYPTYYYPNRMHEEIQIWRCGSKNHDGSRSEKLRINGYVKREIANDVWHIAPVPPNQESHPCPFPEEIAHRLIKLYSRKQGLIVDPMCGSGTVPKVASALSRDYFACDIQQDYVDIAKDRVEEQYERRDQLIPNYDQQSVRGP